MLFIVCVWSMYTHNAYCTCESKGIFSDLHIEEVMVYLTQPYFKKKFLGWLSMAGSVSAPVCLKAMWTLWSAPSGPGSLTEGQTATNTPERSYSNLPCVFSQSSNTRETERGRARGREGERESTKAHVKEHKAFATPGLTN